MKSEDNIAELSQHVLEALRKDEGFVLCRTSTRTSSFPAGSSVYAAGLGGLKEVRERILIEGRTGLRLGSRLLVLFGQRGQTPLVLEDACGETLVRFLPGPMEMTQFLRRTVGLTTAIGGLHKMEQIH